MSNTSEFPEQDLSAVGVVKQVSRAVGEEDRAAEVGVRVQVRQDVVADHSHPVANQRCQDAHIPYTVNQHVQDAHILHTVNQYCQDTAATYNPFPFPLQLHLKI